MTVAVTACRDDWENRAKSGVKVPPLINEPIQIVVPRRSEALFRRVIE